MNPALTPGQIADLERLIDHHSIQVVLEALSEICGCKGEHIATQWQDTALAKRWLALEGHIGIASTKAEGL